MTYISFILVLHTCAVIFENNSAVQLLIMKIFSFLITDHFKTTNNKILHFIDMLNKNWNDKLIAKKVNNYKLGNCQMEDSLSKHSKDWLVLAVVVTVGN